MTQKRNKSTKGHVVRRTRQQFALNASSSSTRQRREFSQNGTHGTPAADDTQSGVDAVAVPMQNLSPHNCVPNNNSDENTHHLPQQNNTPSTSAPIAQTSYTSRQNPPAAADHCYGTITVVQKRSNHQIRIHDSPISNNKLPALVGQTHLSPPIACADHNYSIPKSPIAIYANPESLAEHNYTTMQMSFTQSTLVPDSPPLPLQDDVVRFETDIETETASQDNSYLYQDISLLSIDDENVDPQCLNDPDFLEKEENFWLTLIRLNSLFVKIV